MPTKKPDAFTVPLFPPRSKATPRKTVPSEHDEQVVLVKWARIQSRTHPPLSTLFAIPNGGHRYKSTAVSLAREGVRAGVPDLCLPWMSKAPCGHVYGALWIELKRQRRRGVPTGRVSPEQAWWRDALISAGHAHVVCYGFDQARAALLDYLAGRLPLPDVDASEPSG
jgi:hypothetical protein